jgi:hypothetical protein
MSDTSRSSEKTLLAVWSWVLHALALVLLLLGVAMGLVLLDEAVPLGLTLRDIALASLCAAGGLSVAVGIELAGVWLRRQGRAADERRRVLTLLQQLSERPAAPRAVDSFAKAEALLAEVRDQLVALNAHVMLTEEQREIHKRQQLADVQESLNADFERALSAGDIGAAEAGVADLAQRGGTAAQLDQWRKRIATARETVEAEDVRRGIQRVRDLMAMAKFDEADPLARELAERYAESQPVQDLLARVRREAQVHDQEQRQRLYGEVQRHASQRQWRRAYAAAQALMDRHAGTLEAQTVGTQIETLRDNARIEEVRELRDIIRDLINRHRFAEAADRAQDVILRFPETAAADELRQQLPRLRERAKDSQ